MLGEVKFSDAPLEITIFVDKTSKTMTISDNGIGMSKEELIANLGTIARSGSKQFVESLSSESSAASVEESTAADKHGIIGQFGVGFYSAFMTSNSVSVESIPALTTSGDAGAHKWFSDGSGEFFVEAVPDSTDFVHGTRVTLNLKDSCLEFADLNKIKDIIKKYSSFVAFPIKLNGEAVNTVSALWTESKENVTPSQYKEFYRFIANAHDDPKYTLHFRTDAPIDLKVLLFIPGFHSEKFGQVRSI